MFLNEKELSKIGFKSFGKNVLISSKCSIYNPGNIEIGDNVRIDDFCIISVGKDAFFKFGNFTHIGCQSSIIGGADVVFEDFSCISGHVAVYSTTDDFRGGGMTNPMVPNEFRNCFSGNVVFGKHALVGSHSTILPGVVLATGVAVYAHSLVYKSCLDEFGIYWGIPVKKIKNRESKKILKYEKEIYRQ